MTDYLNPSHFTPGDPHDLSLPGFATGALRCEYCGKYTAESDLRGLDGGDLDRQLACPKCIAERNADA